MNKRIWTIGLATVVAIVASSALSTAPGPDTKKPTLTVVIENHAFRPSEIRVRVGSTLTWVNKDAVEHSALSNGGQFDTGLFKSGESATVTFSKVGRFDYYCEPHPFMKGLVIVEEGPRATQDSQN